MSEPAADATDDPSPEPKVPPLHPTPAQGLKSKFMPVNPTGTVPEPVAADEAGTAARRANAGAPKSGGTGPKQ